MLAVRIAQLRKSRGMSQLELARLLNISPSAEGMYEQGRRTPSLEILINMSALFHVSLDYLITGTEGIETNDPCKKVMEIPMQCQRCCFSTYAQSNFCMVPHPSFGHCSRCGDIHRERVCRCEPSYD